MAKRVAKEDISQKKAKKSVKKEDVSCVPKSSIYDVACHLLDLVKYQYDQLGNQYVNTFYSSDNDTGLFSTTWKLYQNNKSKTVPPKLDKDNYYLEVLDNQRGSYDDFRSYSFMLQESMELLFLNMLKETDKEDIKKLFFKLMESRDEEKQSYGYFVKYLVQLYELGWDKRGVVQTKNVKPQIQALYNHLKN